MLKWLPGFRSGYLGMIAGAGIWAAGEGFGGPYTSGASDIGTAVAGNSPSSAAPSSRQRPPR